MKRKRVEPGPGQESVWDYPRPPAIEYCPRERIKIVAEGITIADSGDCYRVLETSHPPVYYVPISDVRFDLFVESERRSWCEWKGQAHYFHLQLPTKTISDAAWTYPMPSERFRQLLRTIAVYPSKMDACFVDSEQATPQDGDFYGGWITSRIVGPFKGAAGTWGW